MRDKLSAEMIQTFAAGAFRMNHDAQELADWLIEMDWVKESPDDNPN